METFLQKKFGEARGSELFKLTRQRFEKLFSQATKKSKQQTKVFKNMLLPRIALYQILLEQNFSQEEALKVLEQHMIECNAIGMRKKYEMLDRLPCAYGLFHFGFVHVVKHSDLWDADIDDTKKDEFGVTMRRCFWNDTFHEYGCPELCRFACECDDITYSDLHHIDFHRTQTLGTGGNCCDFKFKKK